MTSDLIDSDDLVQLRQEILRLRDQALGVEARNEYLAGRISNQDDQINELQNRADERDTWVAERDARIAERDARIAEKDTQIVEKDAQIAEKDTRIAQLEAEILRLQSLENRSAIKRLARRIATRSRNNEQP